MTAHLDLLTDASRLRGEVRELLANWELGELATIQESATAYPEAIWTAFRRQFGPRLKDPESVRIALEEVGAARCTLPVHEGLVQPLCALQALGGSAQHHREALLEGRARYALALSGEAVVTRQGDGWRLSGRVRHVAYGDSADLVLVPARHTSGPVLATTPARGIGVRRTTRPTLTGDRLTDFEFEAVAVDEPLAAGVAEAMAAAEMLGTIAVASELVGMSARLLEITAARVKSREAFGAPLAALQSVQLRAADMYLDFIAARAAVAEAAAVGTGPLVAAAKITATGSALAIAAGAHQLCGGWGLLDEAGLHHYTRAIKAAENQLGSPRECRTVIARYLKA